MTEVKPLTTREQELNDAQPLMAHEIARFLLKYTYSAFPFDKIDDARLLATITALKSENENLRELLRDVTDALDTYGPDFVHGEPKKIVVKRARAALAKG